MRVFIAFAVVLGGCSALPLPPLEGVAERCMVRPQGLPEMKAGDDLVTKSAELRRSYAQVASRLRCTQRYIATVTK